MLNDQQRQYLSSRGVDQEVIVAMQQMGPTSNAQPAAGNEIGNQRISQ